MPTECRRHKGGTQRRNNASKLHATSAQDWKHTVYVRLQTKCVGGPTRHLDIQAASDLTEYPSDSGQDAAHTLR
jgi:hypothetical protein